MKSIKYQKRVLAVLRGKTCPCGQPAVRYSAGTYSCAGCIEKDAAIYATDRIRGTCGFPGALDFYRVVGLPS